MFERIAIILLVNIVFYAKSLSYKYVSDDIPSSQRKEEHPKWKRWLLVLEGHLKSNPFIDHLITLILHSLVCVFIYTGFGASDISFLASILFSFNPTNTQGSVWISGRGYVFSALGMLMALTFPVIGGLFLVLATYSNAGFLAPLCLIGSKHPYLLGALPIIWLFHYQRFKKNVMQKIKMEMYTEDRKIEFKKLILLIKTFSFYFIHALIPIKNTFYHSYFQSMAGAGKERSYSLKDRFFWLGLIIISAIGLYWIMIPWNLASFGLLWWTICILPFCNLFRMQQEIAERYVFLPNVGLMVALAWFLQDHPIIQACMVTAYAVKTWFWMEAFKDDYFIVEHSCVNDPNAWFCWHVKAMKRWDQQSYQEAVILWTMAKIISPNEFKILFNISTALKLSKHDKEADQFLLMAERNIPAGQETLAGNLIADWRAGKMAIVL